ncbi:MAG: hypothetical protein QW359_00105 [Metallosphaera sp.]
MYDDLLVADARMLPFRIKHSTLQSRLKSSKARIGVVGRLSRTPIVLSLPALPNRVDMKYLIEKAINVTGTCLGASFS